MSEESDVEMKSALPKKKTKKQPVSPTSELLKERKRLSTKEMIDEALAELKSRKGTSLVAIKKYMELKYNVDVEKIKHIIKKYLKSSVEDGTIVQTKGVGATGSFKLVVNKKEKKIVKKMDKKEKPDKENKDKKEDKRNKEDKKVKSKSKQAESKPKEEKAKKNKVDPKDKEEKKKSSKAKTDKKTPKKKRAPMKRKSIGTIIKAPKMKPAKAKKT